MIHSEFSAILGVPAADLEGAVAFVYRENKQGKPAMARPCACCYNMFLNCGIRRVYFTTDGGYGKLTLN
jgi:deoxycytidylate deaminase